MTEYLSGSFDQAPAAMLITDDQARILAVNQAFVSLSGYTAQQMIGAKPSLMKSGRQDRRFYESLWSELTSTNAWAGELWNRHSSGRVFAVHLSITAVLDQSRKVTNYIAVMSDITARKREEERARRTVNADPLTGLPDRTLLLDRLDRACSSHRREKRPAALVFINVDGFQQINDLFGFEAGDALLREMGRRLKTSVRDSDTAARYDGDIFAVILPNLADQQDIALVARKLLGRLSDTYHLGNHHRAYVTVSLGIALLPSDGSEVDDLIRCAGLAVHQAKLAGRHVHRFYAATMNTEAVQRLELEHDLHEALRNHQFELHFLPIVASAQDRLAGAEALIRWNRGGRLVAPLDFLPLAEETGLIVPIGDWVLQEVADCLIANRLAGAPLVPLSVNISPRQLRDSDIFDRVHERLQAANVPPNLLVLELAESALAAISAAEQSVLQKVASFGMDLSIDNYGTGYSSLRHLRKVPISSLKIDKVFIRNAGSDPDDAAITDAILAMARSLGIRTIAEGIETSDQWDFMRAKACDFGQGYLFSKPLTKDEFLAYSKGTLALV